MKYRIVHSPDAQADISSAVWWYQQKDLNLAFRFTLEAVATLRRIAQYPYSYRLIKGTVRRADLKRFPYSIYYSLDIDRISVIAVIHQRRADSAWMGRGNGHS